MALMRFPLCYSKCLRKGGLSDDGHGPCNVVAAVSDSGVICVIIDVISPSFRMGKLRGSGRTGRCPGKELPRI